MRIYVAKVPAISALLGKRMVRKRTVYARVMPNKVGMAHFMHYGSAVATQTPKAPSVTLKDTDPLVFPANHGAFLRIRIF